MPGNLGFIGPTYQSENPSVDAERLVNLYPERIESGPYSSKSGMAYYHTPGTTVFAALGDSPVRAMWAGAQGLYVLSGATLFQLDYTGSVVNSYTLANPAGGMAPGQIVFVPSGPGLTVGLSGVLMVWDGSPGYAGGSTYPNVFFVDGTTGTPPTIMSGAGIGCMDGYGIILRPACSPGAAGADPFPISTADGTQFNLSPIFLANPAGWDPLQFAIKTGAGDALQVIYTPGANPNGAGPEECWLMGTDTIEVWYDTGGTTTDPFPFQRVPGAFIAVGVWASQSVASVGSPAQLVFLGGDQRGVGIVYAMNGYTPQRVSNHAIEYAIAQYQAAGQSISNAVGYSYAENGHNFYVLSFPGGRTFAADFSCPDASGRPMWHERGLGSTLAGLSNSWLFHAWATGQHFVAGDNTANVYVSSLATYQDSGNPILRARIGPAISNEQKWVRHGQFWLSIGGPSNISRTYALDWSNDGGSNYGNSFNLGVQVDATTKFGRVLMNNLGRSRQRNYRVQTTDNEPQAWIDAYVEIA